MPRPEPARDDPPEEAVADPVDGFDHERVWHLESVGNPEKGAVEDRPGLVEVFRLRQLPGDSVGERAQIAVTGGRAFAEGTSVGAEDFPGGAGLE